MTARIVILLCAALSSLCSAQSLLPQLPVPPAAALKKKAELRPSLLQVASKLGAVEEPEPVLGRVVPWYPACGSGVLPYLWADRTPYLGERWSCTFSMWSLPREDGVYDAAGAWLIVSLFRPVNLEETPHVFPNGCPLLWDLSSPAVLVWSFTGQRAYQDAIVSRRKNARDVLLELAIPADHAFSGQPAWIQGLVLDHGELKATQLLQVVFGYPPSEFR